MMSRVKNDDAHVHGGLKFWQIVVEDLSVQGGQWSRPGFHALLMYRIGRERHRHGSIARKLIGIAYHLAHRVVRNFYGIELHSSAHLGRRVKIAHQGGIVIHENASIGDGCVIRQCVTIGAASDETFDRAPRLGCNISVGAGAVIMGRVTLGDNCRIGPNSVVMVNVPAGAMITAPASRLVT